MVLLHGDGQYAPEYIDRLISKLIKTDCDAVFGSRMIKKWGALKGGMPLYKFIGNIFLTNFFNFLHGTSFTDCHTGYWVYNLNKVKYRWLKNFDNGFIFDLDMRLKLLKEKLSIREIFINTRYGTERSSTHIKYAFFFLLKTLLKKIFK